MRNKPKPGGEVVRELVRKFPNAPNLTLARMAFRDHPLLFTNLDRARFMVRYYRGAIGENRRRYAIGRTPIQIPEGRTEVSDWKAQDIPGKLKALILSDIHVPWHNRLAVEQSIEFGVRNGADVVLINGDGCDFHGQSKFEKNPENKDFPGEIKTMRILLEYLRQKFRKARIIYKMGNHDERYYTYMRQKAPELLGLDVFELSSILHLDRFGIEMVKDKRPVRLGHLNVLHGHEYKFAISNPVNPARGLFLRCKAHAIAGHFHVSSHHTANTVEQSAIATWSTGCLCDLHPEYAPLNDWIHGFAFVEVENDGKFHVHNKVIRGGKLY